VAKGIGMAERTARDMVQRLAARGHLRITLGRGPGNPNRYQFVIANRQPPSAFESGKAAAACRIDKPSGDENRQPPAAINRQPIANETGSRLPTNYLMEPSEKPSEVGRAREDSRDLFGKPNGSRPPKTKAARRRPSLPIRDDYAPNDRTIALNAELGFSDSDLAESTERIKDWARQKDERKADWNAAHRNWIREDARRRQPQVARSQPYPSSSFRRLMERNRER
jgi:hypothetical protein